MRNNLLTLANTLGLNELEREILGFCALLHSDSLLNRCFNLYGVIDNRRLNQLLAVMLERPVEGIARALEQDGRLIASGLLSVSYCVEAEYLEQRLSFNSHDLLYRLCYHHGTVGELFQHSFRPSSPPSLVLDDYSHIQEEVELTLRYLTRALKQSREGVNVLIYGPPGTGKTELCRLFAAELGRELYEIAISDRDGAPISGGERLCALRSAMHVLHDSGALILLDEIEDIFQETGKRSLRAHKGWVNRMLEENRLPCFWLSNAIDNLDPAYIRRFDVVIEAPNPARHARERILRKLGGGKLVEPLLNKLAAHEAMTPAVFERAYKVARLASPRAGRMQNEAIQCLLDATLKAQGHAPLKAYDSGLPEEYSPELINTDIAMDDLLAGLKRCPQARLCFYGQPGTGKSAFARWIAEQLGKPLLAQKVSDLVGPFVGETERRLAAAFQLAERDDAVLLLDEVDSFLQERGRAQHSWEITAVNEMLTQMESFEGLFIASTNLLRDLDGAAMRRFDLKVCFMALRPQQIARLFQKHLVTLGLKDPHGLAEQSIRSIHNLTPGDFAAVARRARFKPFANAFQFAEALAGEVRLKKEGSSQPIGFVH